MNTTAVCGVDNRPGIQNFMAELPLKNIEHSERDTYLAVATNVCRVFNEVRRSSIDLFLREHLGDGADVNTRIDGPNTLVASSPSEAGLETTILISSEKAYKVIGSHVAMTVSDDFTLVVEFDDTFTDRDNATEFTKVAAMCVTGIVTAIVKSSRYYSSALDVIASFEMHTSALCEELVKLQFCSKDVNAAHSPKVSHYSFNGGDYLCSHPHLSKGYLLFNAHNAEMLSCFVSESRYAAHISSRMETLLLETVLHTARNFHKESVAFTLCVLVFSPCVHTVDMQLLVDLSIALVGVEDTKRNLLEAASLFNSKDGFNLYSRSNNSFLTLSGLAGSHGGAPRNFITVVTFKQLAAHNFVLSKVVAMQCNIFSELEFAYELLMSPEVRAEDSELAAALNCALATCETAEAVDPRLLPWRL